jgi:VWFA-related protein
MRPFAAFIDKRAAIVLAFLLVPVAPADQNPPPNLQIRVSTRLVQLGVIARDKNGPVQDLTKDDFVILDHGKPREISLFTRESGEPATAPELAKMLPPNAFSDLPQYGASKPRSVTIVLLDNLNTLYGSVPESTYEATPYWVEDLALQRAKTHLIEFIKTLDPRDGVAIYGLHHSVHVVCDFTNDRDQLLTILKNYDTKSLTNRRVVEPGKVILAFPGDRRRDVFVQGSGFENGASTRLAGGANADRAAETMAALQQIAAHVANIPGRKNLVWLTANLPFSGSDLARILGPANIAVYPVDARGLLAQSATVGVGPWGTADADDVSGASGHLDNMPAQSSQPIGIATMRKVAEETGGQAFVNTNDITGAIRKAVEDSTVTYTLGFYLDASSLDGKFHEIKLESKRKGVTLLYPKGYFAYRDAAATPDHDQVLLTAVQSPVESSLIPLEARVDRVSKPEPNSLNLACAIDIHNIQLAQNGGVRKGTLIVYTIEQDATGKVVQKWDKVFNLQFTDNQYAALIKTGMLFHQTVHLHAGTTTLRLLVEDAGTTNIGSLIIPLSQVN